MRKSTNKNQEEVTTTQEITTIKLETIHTESSDADVVVKPKVRVEELSIGSNLIDDLNQLVYQANIRRILIKTEDGNTLLNIPLTAGLVGGALGLSFFPLASVLGSAGLLATNFLFTRVKIVVEREE
ncbi:hypothetical protein NUACC21_80070 [Scytonema sp. NUACC21]